MKLKKTFFTLLLFSILSCINKKPKNEFYIVGDFYDSNTNVLVLKYVNSDLEYIKDTLQIVNGRFNTKGFINGSTRVTLEGARNTNTADDKNVAQFFIEAKKNKISVSANNFKNIEVIGSNTQNEYVSLSTLTEPIYNEIKKIRTKIKDLQINPEWESIDSIKKSVLSNQNEWQLKLGEIKKLRLEFAKSHSDSYISAYYLDFYKNSIDYSELTKAYLSLEKNIIKSTYGIRVFEALKMIEKTSIGKKGEDFTLIDFNGNELELNSFKGNYVLLDFWASWCSPCVQGLPKLKKIFNKHNIKGLDIISLSLDKNEESWNSAVKKYDMQIWNNVFIGSSNSNNGDNMYKKYNVEGIPMYILIDPKGYITGRYSASKDSLWVQNLEKKLDAIYSEK